jgi:capsular polysaccharide transport system ATP-binding protein
MIRFESVTKSYPTPNGRHFVFRDVSFEIPDGVNVGILGRNGAGKSTLVRLLAGVDIPNEGRITRTGRISWPMGLTSGLQTGMSGRENARFVCRIQGVPSHGIPAILDWVEEFAEIDKFFDLPVRTYSSGMRARLRFAITMAFDFDLYIIDELTAVGDQRFKKKSRMVFKEKRSKASFIKVSHSLSELMTECDSGIFINEQTLTYYPAVEDAVAAYVAIVGDDGEEQARDRKARGRAKRPAAREAPRPRPPLRAAPRVRPLPPAGQPARTARPGHLGKPARRAARAQAAQEGLSRVAPGARVKPPWKAKGRQRDRTNDVSRPIISHTPAPMAPRLPPHRTKDYDPE